MLLNLLLKEPAIEKQSMVPPRIHRIEPAQPMKSAAPSSYLRTKSNALFFLNWLSNIKTLWLHIQIVLTSVPQTLGRKTLLLSGVHRGSMLKVSRGLRRTSKKGIY